MNKSKTHARYSSLWGTPPEWLQCISMILGEGYYDPCPADWTPLDPDGLSTTTEWGDRIYCNHPGGRGSTKKWWTRFAAEIQSGSQGIWAGFSVEQLRHIDRCETSLWDMPGYLILPQTRVRWTDPKTGESGKSPSNWSFFWSTVAPGYLHGCRVIKTGGTQCKYM